MRKRLILAYFLPLVALAQGTTAFLTGNDLLSLIRCAFDRVDQGFSCSSGMGAFLYFNIRSGQGGTAFLYGSAVEYQGRRDDLQVSAFTCQKM